MNRIKALILGTSVFTLAGVGIINSPMAATPEGFGPGNRPFAHGRRMHGGAGGGAPLITMALNHKTDLNLSADQVANLEKIKTQFQSQVTPLHQQLRSIEKEIATHTQQGPANLIHIKAKIQEAEKLRSEMRYLRLEALENGKSALTSQQQDQLKTLVRARHENFRKMHRQSS